MGMMVLRFMGAHEESALKLAATIYFEEELGRRLAAKLLTKDEAQRIAANIAKSPKPAATHNP